MIISACVDRLEEMGYIFRVTLENCVRVSLPGGLPAPPEAELLLEHLRENNEELKAELRFRARSCEAVGGRQTRITHPVEVSVISLCAMDRVSALRAKVEEMLGNVGAESSILTEDEQETMCGLREYLHKGLRVAEGQLMNPYEF